MVGIVGVEGLSEDDVRQQVQMGARFVMFCWAVSVILMSFRRTSPIYFARPGEQPRGWKYTLLTLLVGWWGIPWGPIFTIQALITNLRGGHRRHRGGARELHAGPGWQRAHARSPVRGHGAL
jgi:hypothetical protein